MTVEHVNTLTDEQILKEFVRRFNCDAAVLVYLDQEYENGLGRWRTTNGKKWMNNLMKSLEKNISTEKH